MKLNTTPREVAPRSTEATLQGRFRNKLCKLIGIGAVALGVTACGPDDPGNGTGGTTAVGGSGGTGGIGAMGGGGGEVGGGGEGAGGSDPCEGETINALAEIEVGPGQIKTATVDLGDSHPNKAYNDLSVEVNGDILNKSGLVVMMPQTNVTAESGYELVEMKGFRVLVVDPNENLVMKNGVCSPNTMDMNSGMNDVSKRPVVTLPGGMRMSAFRDVENGPSMLEDFEMTAMSTRITLSELNGPGHFPANSKPVVTSNVTRDHDGYITIDLAGTTDEGDGSNLVLENLGVMASDGLVFAAVPNEPGKFRSVNPSILGSFDLFVSGLSEGIVDDTTQVSGVNVPPAPALSNLNLDCSSTFNFCLTNQPYPFTFTAVNSANCTVTTKVISGNGTPGFCDPVILNGNDASTTCTMGSDTLDVAEYETDCTGPGGAAQATIQATFN